MSHGRLLLFAEHVGGTNSTESACTVLVGHTHDVCTLCCFTTSNNTAHSSNASVNSCAVEDMPKPHKDTAVHDDSQCWLVSGDAGGGVCLWDASTATLVRHIQHPSTTNNHAGNQPVCGMTRTIHDAKMLHVQVIMRRMTSAPELTVTRVQNGAVWVRIVGCDQLGQLHCWLVNMGVNHGNNSSTTSRDGVQVGTRVYARCVVCFVRMCPPPASSPPTPAIVSMYNVYKLVHCAAKYAHAHATGAESCCEYCCQRGHNRAPSQHTWRGPLDLRNHRPCAWVDCCG